MDSDRSSNGSGKDVSLPSGNEVGYRKPPKHSRFRPGQSGNARGRPRGHKNLTKIVTQILNESVTIREGDKVKKVTKTEAIIMTTVNRALKGDNRAVMTLIQLARETGQLQPEPMKIVLSYDDAKL